MARIAKPLDIASPFRLSDAGYPVMAQGRDALEDLLKDCLLTSPGERPYRPTYGCWLRRVLFANVNEPSLIQARSEIFRASGQWVPQVTIDRVDFVVSDTTVKPVIVWHPSGSEQVATTTLEFSQ